MGQAASAANGDRRVVESFEFEHRPDALFDSLVVLFNKIVQALARSDSHSCGKLARLLHFSRRPNLVIIERARRVWLPRPFDCRLKIRRAPQMPL